MISSVLGLLYHHCYSCQKTRSRLHTPISTVVHAEVVCAPKMLPIGIFLSHILRSKIIALWDMSQYQNSPRISLETSVFYLNFRVRFFLVMLWTSKLDKAAEETWVYCSTLPLAVERKLTSYQSAMILDHKIWLRKMPIGRIVGAQTTSAWTTVEIGMCSHDFVFW